MRKFISYAAVALAGYFVGFYEMKYKVMKVILINQFKEESQNDDDDEES